MHKETQRTRSPFGNRKCPMTVGGYCIGMSHCQKRPPQLSAVWSLIFFRLMHKVVFPKKKSTILLCSSTLNFWRDAALKIAFLYVSLRCNPVICSSCCWRRHQQVFSVKMRAYLHFICYLLIMETLVSANRVKESPKEKIHLQTLIYEVSS